MKFLRLFFAGLIVLLFSGALAPVSFASPDPQQVANTPGLKFDAYYPINASNPPARSTSAYTRCASGTVANINHSFGNSIFGCPGDFVMVHYYGFISSPVAATANFRAYADDGFFLSIDGNTIIDDWQLKGCSYVDTGSFTFAANTWYEIDAWFYEWGGGACSLLYSDINGSWNAVPTTMFAQDNVPTIMFTDTRINSLARRNQQYSSNVVASGPGTITYSLASGSDPLPDGLSLNPATGEISGSPSTYGEYDFSITATSDDLSNSPPATTDTLVIVVGEPPDLSSVVVGATIPSGSAMEPIDVSGFGGYPAASYSADSDWPNGVTVTGTNGLLQGTPTGEGIHDFTVTAANVFGESVSPNLRLTITKESYFPAQYEDILGHTFVGGARGNYSSGITARGYPNPTYSIVDDPLTVGSNGLPSGLTLNSSTGRITGAADTVGTYPFRIRVVNGIGNGDTSRTQTIVVATVPAVTFDDIETEAYLGVAFDQRPTFSGYPSPTYSITGSLPEGVTLKSNGQVSGTPTESGTFSFRVCATTYSAETCTRPYSLRVRAEPVYRNNNDLPPTAQVGVLYSGHINFLGLVDSYAISPEGDGLPQGLSIGSATGIISGTPTQTGVFKFSVAARGSTGQYTTTPAQTITVNKIPVWTRQTLGGLNRTPINNDVDAFVSAAGYPAPTYSISSGVLPRGLTLNANTGAILGRPTQHGSFTFTIAASNSVGNIDSAPISLMVTQNPVAMDETIAPTVMRNLPFADAIVYDAYPEPTYSIAPVTPTASGLVSKKGSNIRSKF
jgi:hypothetical protein